ncbi:MAG: sensor histidine kinase [Bacteroidota bacterium]
MTNKNFTYRFFTIAIVAIVLIDIAGHFMFGWLFPDSHWTETLMSTVIFFILALPIIYVAGYRPLLRSLAEKQQNEEALKESEQSYRTLMNSGQALVWLAGVDKGCTFFNSVWLDFTGRTPEQEMGYGWAEGVHPDDLKRCVDIYVQAFDRRESFSMEYRLRRADGVFRWLIDEGSPRFDSKGEFIGYIGHCLDITERKLSEEALRSSEEKYRYIYNNTPVMLHSINAQGILVSVSDYWLSTMGYTREEVIGRRSTEFLTEASRNYARDVVLPEFLRTGQCSNIEYQFVKKNGEVIDVLLSAISEKDENGHAARSVAVITEITERKKAEQQLKELTKELKNTNVELEQFAYIASHDLQEPLRMISSYTQLLENRYKDKLDQDANDFIGFAVDGANRMQKMIQSFLVYSRTTRDTSPLTVVDCNSVINDVKLNLQISIRETGAVIDCAPLPVIVGHHELLVQLFQNLIGNALKFRGDVAPVISVGVSNDETHWTFFVKDNGIGIEEAYFEKIFEIFQRLHSPGEYPGTGIGLTICKNIVERHHGSIRVESRPGQGTTFIFTISSQLKVS